MRRQREIEENARNGGGAAEATDYFSFNGIKTLAGQLSQRATETAGQLGQRATETAGQIS